MPDDTMQVVGWEDAEVRETHISRVLLLEDRVLKTKKRVNLGFLDFTTPQGQREACNAERALNDRTAPGVTKGVRALTRTERPHELAVDGDGEVWGWAVEMERLPDSRRMASLLERGALGVDEIDHVARWLASFHNACPVRTDLGGPAVVSELMEQNFDQLPEADALVGADRAEAARSWQRRALRADVVQARLEASAVRDGHGDLRLDHVYLLPPAHAPRVLAIDGIEFDERYRCLDVAADLGFLVMELVLHGRSDLAERLAARWARHTGDWGVYDVLDGYVAYRAWVRAKVRMLQHDTSAARQRLEVACGLADPRPSPVLVAVGGPIAAGKSTVAEQLAKVLQAPIIDADRTRKQLAGTELQDRLGTTPFAGAYSASATARVYEALARAAASVLQSGRSAILDASFRTPELRAHAIQLGQRLGVAVRFVACTSPRSVLAQRLRARDADPDIVSDAREPLLDRFLAEYHAPQGPGVHTVDTSEPVDLEALQAFVRS